MQGLWKRSRVFRLSGQVEQERVAIELKVETAALRDSTFHFQLVPKHRVVASKQRHSYGACGCRQSARHGHGVCAPAESSAPRARARGQPRTPDAILNYGRVGSGHGSWPRKKKLQRRTARLLISDCVRELLVAVMAAKGSSK